MENQSKNDLPMLPEEIWLYLFSFLTRSDIGRMKRVSKDLRRIARDKALSRATEFSAPELFFNQDPLLSLAMTLSGLLKGGNVYGEELDLKTLPKITLTISGLHIDFPSFRYAQEFRAVLWKHGIAADHPMVTNEGTINLANHVEIKKLFENVCGYPSSIVKDLYVAQGLNPDLFVDKLKNSFQHLIEHIDHLLMQQQFDWNFFCNSIDLPEPFMQAYAEFKDEGFTIITDETLTTNVKRLALYWVIVAFTSRINEEFALLLPPVLYHSIQAAFEANASVITGCYPGQSYFGLCP